MLKPRRRPTQAANPVPISHAAPRPPTPGTPDMAALAESIKRAGMAEVASVALHTAKPLAWVGGQMLWVLQPLIGGLGKSRQESLSAFARLLEQDGGVDHLIERLEAPEDVTKKPGKP